MGKVADTVVAFSRANTHPSGRLRKTGDEYCVSLLAGLREAYGAGKQKASVWVPSGYMPVYVPMEGVCDMRFDVYAVEYSTDIVL